MEEKELFKCNSITDGYEYGRMVPYFFKKMFISTLLDKTFYILALSMLMLIVTKNEFDAILLFIITEVFIVVLLVLFLPQYCKWKYDLKIKAKKLNINYENYFYSDSFVVKNDDISVRLEYDTVDLCIETNTNFYLYLKKSNNIIILQKNECDLELVNFIRKKYEDLNRLDSRLGGTIKFK